MSKKVLLIAYPFLNAEQSGSVRLRGLAEFLPDFGWEPFVLTAGYDGDPGRLPDARIVRAEQKDLSSEVRRRLAPDRKRSFKEQVGVAGKGRALDLALRVYREVYAYPDTAKGWCTPAVVAAGRLLQGEDFGAVISSSAPVTSHVVAASLKRDFNLPWIADLRDLWTQNYIYPYSTVRRRSERRLEVKTLSSADALVTVSEPLASLLGKLHRREAHSIPNGFHPSEVSRGAKVSEEFSIIYTGTVYRGGARDPGVLFRALSRMIAEGEIDRADLRIDFYGRGYGDGWLERYAGDLGLQGVVSSHGLIKRDEALRRQREAQVLLLLAWNDPSEPGVYTGKVFEYLASGRPILSVGAGVGGVVDELLRRTGTGVHASSAAEVEAFLKKAYGEFKSEGRVLYNPVQSEVEVHSQREMAKKFADILDALV